MSHTHFLFEVSPTLLEQSASHLAGVSSWYRDSLSISILIQFRDREFEKYC